VSEPEIERCLAATEGDAHARLETLKRELKCGTNCGSCTPELRALAAKDRGNAGRMVA
jgi:assimilatory nitrate reductase catalytic subunit